METINVRIHCNVCNGFDIHRFVDANEDGYFEIPNGYCPYCYSPLIQVIDGKDKQDAERGNATASSDAG